jgi:hypothetical protein
MTIKVGINGFGRIGRLVLRAAWDWPELEFVQINDPAADAATHAHLLNFDSVHGRWSHEATAEGDAILIDGRAVRLTANRAIADTDWSGCDVVIEASGKMTASEKLQPYLDQGREACRGECAREGKRRAERGDGRKPPSFRPGRTSHADGRLLHHQLPGARGEGDPRKAGHPPRLHHHHPRPYQYAEHARPAAQGLAPGTRFAA